MSWDGELPEGWMWARLEELVRRELPLCYGVVQPGDDDPNGVLLIRVCDLECGTVNLDNVRRIRPDVSQEYQRTSLKGGELLVSLVGTVGRTAIVPEQLRGANIARAIARVATIEQVLPRWVQAWLDTPAMQVSLLREAREVARKTLNLNQLREVGIPVAPLNEQRRIVAKIEALTARSRRAKEALDAVPPLLEKLRQSILAAAFRGDLTADWRAAHPDVEPASELLKRIRVERRRRWEDAELARMKAKGKPPTDDRWKAKYEEPAPVDDSELPELPEGWAWACLDEATVLSGGITKGQRRVAGTCLESVPYLRVANVQRGHLDLTEVSEIDATHAEIEAMQLRPGDVLLNEGGDRDKLGRGWVWDGQLPRCIHQNHVFRARPVSVDVQPELISHFANTHGQDYFLDQGKQTTNLASVSMSRVRRCPLPIPPRSESAELVLRVRAGLAKLGALAASVNEGARYLECLDSSVLAKAFRGELVPQDPNDEPASALLERIRSSSSQEPSGTAGRPRKRGARNR